MLSDKPHPPTKRRLDRARRDGQIIKSQLFSSITGTLAGLAVIFGYARYCWVKDKILLEYYLLNCMQEVHQCGIKALGFLAEIVTLVLGVGAVIGLAVQVWHTGISCHFGLSWPRWARISPAAGWQRMMTGIKRIPLYTVMIGAVAAIFMLFVQAALGPQNVPARSALQDLGTRLLALILGFTALDLWLWRQAYRRELGMSNEELRQELREEEGNPHIRARRRACHAVISREEMVARIRRSRVVVVQKA